MFSRVSELLARWLQKPDKVAVNSACEYRHISYSFYDKGKKNFETQTLSYQKTLEVKLYLFQQPLSDKNQSGLDQNLPQDCCGFSGGFA